MGGDLAKAPAGKKAPTYLVAAMKDPQSGNLDRIQIVKGWLENGVTHERVYDVAWSGDRRRDPVTGRIRPVGSTVDVATASYSNTIGARELLATWRDPDFDPARGLILMGVCSSPLWKPNGYVA